MTNDQDSNRTHATTIVQLAAGMALFGSATPISKIVGTAFPEFIGALMRVVLGALVLAPFVIKQFASLRRLSRRDWVLVGAIAIAGMFGFSVLMLYGMQRVPGVVGAMIMSTAPAVTAVASVIFFRDRFTWRKSTALTFAVAGVLVLYIGNKVAGSENQGFNDLILGGLMVFAAVCCETAYTLCGKKLTSNADPLMVAALGAVLSIPLFLPFAYAQLDQIQIDKIDVRDWVALVWYGGGTLALGSWLWYAGLSQAQGSIAAGFMGVMPVSALVLSYVLLDEPFVWRHLLGFLLVFVGVLLMSWEHSKHAAMDDSEK